MTSLSIAEKRALEDIFICLESNKSKKIECLKKYLVFYKKSRFLELKKKFPLISIRRKNII